MHFHWPPCKSKALHTDLCSDHLSIISNLSFTVTRDDLRARYSGNTSRFWI